MANFDLIINITDTYVSTHIGHKSKYSTSKSTSIAHPGTGSKIEGWKWGNARWPSYAELSQFSYIPVLFDGGETVSYYYFQSGYGHDTDLFLKGTSIVVTPERNIWSPQVLSGSYYIYNKEWYLFSDQYITETLTVPSHSLSVLPLKDLTPVFVRRFGRNEDTSQLYIAEQLARVMGDPGDTSTPSLTSTEFYLDVLTNPDQLTIETSGVTLDSITEVFDVTSETRAVSLETFPVNITSASSDDASITYEFDNDLGHVRLSDGHTATTVTVVYDKAFAVSYEPHFATDTVSAVSANVNPVHNGVNKGFVQITTEILEPFSIHLEADLPGTSSFNQSNYELELGNNVGKLIATVRNAVGTLLEGIRVYFEWDLPTDLSSITDADGQAFMYYNSPATIENVGDYVSQVGLDFSGEEVAFTADSIPPGTPLDEIWIFALYHTDPFFGLKDQSHAEYGVDKHYEDFLTAEGFTYSAEEQANEIAYRDTNFIDLNNPAKPEAITGMDTPVKQGQKRMILKEMTIAPFVHPNTGVDASSLDKVWWPITPLTLTGDQLVYDKNDLPDSDERNKINSYFIVSNQLETIRAYAYNNSGERVYSNTIGMQITLPDSVNGTYHSAALAEPFVSELLRDLLAFPTNRSLEPGDQGFQAPPTVPFNYPGFYPPGTTGDTPAGFVSLTEGQEVKIPIGFRVKTPGSGITVASLLDQVTFINKHGGAEEPT